MKRKGDCKWVSVEDGLPEDDGVYNVCGIKHHLSGVGRLSVQWMDSKWWYMRRLGCIEEVDDMVITHWQPLPDLPSGGCACSDDAVRNPWDASVQWTRAKDRVPNHQQDCIVISDNGAVRRATFWKTPKDAVGAWYLDGFHKVVLGVILWTPFPIPEDELVSDEPIPDYVSSIPICARCPKGCVTHKYPLGYTDRLAHFCEMCGSSLKWDKRIRVV